MASFSFGAGNAGKLLRIPLYALGRIITAVTPRTGDLWVFGSAAGPADGAWALWEYAVAQGERAVWLTASAEERSQLGDLWTAQPPRVLRSGALGVRDLAGLARSLDVETAQAGWLAEVALAAGLIADDGELTPAFSPTPEFDVWRSRSAGARWATVAQAWWESPRAAYLVGTAPNGGATVGALGPEVRWPAVRGVRADVLGELAGLPAGTAPSAESVIERLLWRRPLGDRRALTDAAEAVLREAEWLGARALGTLTSLGRALVERVPTAELAAAADATLPASVDHVLLQADLTAIAPGPLDGALGRFMRLVSDVDPAVAQRFCGCPASRCAEPSTPGGPPTRSSTPCATPAGRPSPNRWTTSSAMSPGDMGRRGSAPRRHTSALMTRRSLRRCWPTAAWPAQCCAGSPRRCSSRRPTPPPSSRCCGRAAIRRRASPSTGRWSSSARPRGGRDRQSHALLLSPRCRRSTRHWCAP